MIKISINKAKPGMKIAKDIVNEAGMVVIPSGRELTDSLIEKLYNMRIDYIYVEGKKEMPPKEQLFDEIEKKFKYAKDPYTLLIKKIIKIHLEELYK